MVAVLMMRQNLETQTGDDTMTIKDAIASIRKMGVAVTYDAGYAEFRVTPKRKPLAAGRDANWRETLAYYTSDADDAVDTAMHMAAWR